MKSRQFKNILKTAIILPFLTSGLISCAPKESISDYTIMLYLCGSDLESKYTNASKNLDEILAADIPDNCNFIIETGGAKEWKRHGIRNDVLSRYIVKDHALKLVDTQPDASMGNKDTLIDFISFCKDKYKAKHESLVFWDHGGAYLNGFCFDEKFGYDSIDLNEFKYVLDQFKDDKKFDFIGFDCCLIGNFETANICYDYAENFIASADFEPGGGWDYTNWIKSYVNDRDFSVLLKDYEAKCKKECDFPFTLSHLDYSKYDAVLNGFNHLVEKMKNEPQLKKICQAVKNAVGYGEQYRPGFYSNFYDLGNVADNLNVKELSLALDNAIDMVSNGFVKDTHGLAFFYPYYYVQDSVHFYGMIPTHKEYQKFLSSTYSDRKEMIEITDYGTINDNNQFEMSISEESIKYLKDVEYKLFGYGVHENGENYSYCLGYDSDITKLNETTFTPHLKGKWVAFNDEFISLKLVDFENNVATFESPLKLNDQDGTIEFLYNYDTKKFTLYGFTADEEGISSRITPLKDGDKITLLYDNRTFYDEEYLLEGHSFIYNKNTCNFAIKQLGNDFYSAYIEMHDVYDNKYRSNHVIYRYYGDDFVADEIDEDRTKETISKG